MEGEECEIEDDINYNNYVIPEEESTNGEGEKTTRDKITRKKFLDIKMQKRL